MALINCSETVASFQKFISKVGIIIKFLLKRSNPSRVGHTLEANATPIPYTKHVKFQNCQFLSVQIDISTTLYLEIKIDKVLFNMLILEDEYPPDLFFGFRFWDIRVGGGRHESTINLS